MSDAPLVSVIVPVWNGARFLADALDSICAQALTTLEILVVDDGSTDGTAEVARRAKYNARYLAFPHRGLAATRRAGIAAARGSLLAFLDSDDLWVPNKLELQIGLLEANPDTMIVNGHTQLMRLLPSDTGMPAFEKWGEPVLAPSFGSALFRREAIEQLGVFDQRLEGALDLDWYLPARESGVPVLIHADVVQFYRRHEKNTTNNQTLAKQSLLFMLKDSLARRKEQGREGALPPIQSADTSTAPERNS